MKTPTSIYRQNAGLTYAFANPANRFDRDEPAGPEGSVDFTRLRKAEPVAYLLPRTQAWLDALPRNIYPRALSRLYPRIVNLFAGMWGDTEALRAYFDELFADRRRGRQGFPLDVLDDLRALREYHATLRLDAMSRWDQEGCKE